MTLNEFIKFPFYGKLSEAPKPLKNVARLVIYDNDGPEGFFWSACFERSNQIIAAIATLDKDEPWVKEFNFRIENHWE